MLSTYAIAHVAVAAHNELYQINRPNGEAEETCSHREPCKYIKQKFKHAAKIVNNYNI